MHSELCAITIKLQKDISKNLPDEYLSEMFVAPCNIVQSFAKFLANRDDEETFKLKARDALFSDCSVVCEDSNKAITAFECLKKYNLPLSTYAICKDLSENGKPNWKDENAYKVFVEWFSRQ